jgi:preprotein translocase subunit SecY
MIQKQYKPLINKLLITFGILFFYKICTYFPLPGVNLDMIARFFAEQKNTMFGVADLFSGGAISRMSFVALGIMPYITASILMELFAHFDPNIGALKKEKEGMVIFVQKTRYLTVFIALIQSIGVAYGITKMGEGVIITDTTSFLFYSIPMLVMGTVLLMWLGEQITNYGLGNGISLIIFTAIISGLPGGVVNTIDLMNNGSLNPLIILFILFIMAATTVFIIFIEKGERRIPLQYTSSDFGGNYLPIKVNLANVIPAIFAGALISIPVTFGTFFKDVSSLNFINDILTPGTLGYNIVTFLLIFGFTFFYARIAFKVDEVTKNLNDSGSFIPGIRPGEHTKEYLKKITLRLTVFSGIYLGTIATVPWAIMNQLGAPFYFGGIMTLVIVQVTFDFITKLFNEIETLKLKEKEQESFI